MTDAEINSLADRIEKVKAYDGYDLKANLRNVSELPGSGHKNRKVFLIEVNKREIIVKALRLLAAVEAK